RPASPATSVSAHCCWTARSVAIRVKVGRAKPDPTRRRTDRAGVARRRQRLRGAAVGFGALAAVSPALVGAIFCSTRVTPSFSTLPPAFSKAAISSEIRSLSKCLCRFPPPAPVALLRVLVLLLFLLTDINPSCEG